MRALNSLPTFSLYVPSIFEHTREEGALLAGRTNIGRPSTSTERHKKHARGKSTFNNSAAVGQFPPEPYAAAFAKVNPPRMLDRSTKLSHCKIVSPNYWEHSSVLFGLRIRSRSAKLILIYLNNT